MTDLSCALCHSELDRGRCPQCDSIDEVLRDAREQLERVASEAGVLASLRSGDQPAGTDGLRIDYIGDVCPTQAWGRTAGDRPFYFRARHGQWTLRVGPPGAPTWFVEWPRDSAQLVAEGTDDTAGFMDHEQVRRIIEHHLGGAAEEVNER